jgi:hypothetical protein
MRRTVPVRSRDASMRRLDVFVYLWCPLLRVCSYWGPQGYPRQGHNMPRPGIFNMLPSIINIVAPLAQYAAIANMQRKFRYVSCCFFASIQSSSFIGDLKVWI